MLIAPGQCLLLLVLPICTRQEKERERAVGDVRLDLLFYVKNCGVAVVENRDRKTISIDLSNALILGLIIIIPHQIEGGGNYHLFHVPRTLSHYKFFCEW